jgi:amino acid adenylation domain-containing protein
MTGLFINTLPLRIKSDANPRIIGILRATQIQLHSRESVESSRLVNIKEWTGWDHHRELFDTLMVVENYPLEQVVANLPPGLPVRSYSLEESTNYPLTATIVTLENIKIDFCYRENAFDEEIIRRLSRHFTVVLDRMLHRWEHSIDELEMVPPEEKKKILEEFNNTGNQYPSHKTIPQLFRGQVEKIPDRAALIGQIQDSGLPLPNREEYRPQSANHPCTGLLSYRELHIKSDQLAQCLKEKGVGLDTVIAIMAERSLEMIIGIIGILKAGAAYLPLEPSHPPERINYILADSKANILLSAGHHPELTASRSVSFSRLPLSPSSRLPSLSPFPRSPWTNAPSGSLAYVIYTSGTTGRPKGVVIEHHSLINRLCWMQERYPLGEDDTVLHKTPFMFDVSVWEIFWWSLAGAKLGLLVPGGEKDPGKIAGTVVRHRVTVIHFVPSMLSAFLDCLEGKGGVPRLSSLRQVFCSGEALTASQVRRFHDLLYKPCSTRLANLYGPTEATIDVSYYDCLEREEEKIIPIGRPIHNIRLYILGRNLQLQPLGIPGELCIAGAGLARGYLNAPVLTAERFGHDLWDLLDYHDDRDKQHLPGKPGIEGHKIQHTNDEGIPNRTDQIASDRRHFRQTLRPGNEKTIIPGAESQESGANSPSTNPLSHYPTPLRAKSQELRATFYKTGDLARWLADGNIEFLGRLDRQVKIRGFRIELQEIENRILAHHRIKEAVVETGEDKSGDRYVCAYIVPVESGGRKPFRVDKLRSHLLKTLPGYMIPASFVILDKLPVTVSGKIDRSALPGRGSSDESVVPPGDEVELKLIELWAQVLSRDLLLGPGSNFFTLGGHSLKALGLAARIYNAFNVKLPLSELFKRPYLRQQADFIKKADREDYFPVPAVERKEYYPLSPAQERLYFLDQVEETGTVYNMSSILELRGNLKRERLAYTFGELVRRHESLRTSFPRLQGDPVQRIHEAGSLFPLNLPENLQPLFQPGSRLSESDIPGLIQPFDLSQAPLLRVSLLQLAEESYLLVVDMHHIISDAISLEIFTGDFAAIYAGEKLPEPRIHYKDYARWQNRETGKDKMKDQETFWAEELGEEVPVLDLPPDHSRPRARDFQGRHLNFQLDEEITGALKKMALEENVTMYMVLLALLNILLARLSGQEDIIVGSPVAGRRHVDLEQIMGMFVNTLALRNYPSGDKPFALFLKEVRERMLAALDNQDYPFESVVENRLARRDRARNPIFDVMLAMQDVHIFDIDIPGLVLRRREYESGTSKFDLTFTCEETGGRLIFSVEFAAQLFLTATIQRFIAYFKKIAAAVPVNKNIKIREIEIFSPEERRQLLDEFNNTGSPYPKDQRIHQLFEYRAKKVPDFRAVISGAGQMTYGRLNSRSNQLARLLKERGVGCDTVVAVMLEPSLETVIAILAILKAGGAYLPLDPGYPQTRISTMLNSSGATVLLTGGDVKKSGELLREFRRDIIPVDGISEELETRSPENLPGVSPGRSLFYVIYTSGSTGVPKGAGVYHRSFMNLLHWFVTDFGLGPGDTDLLLTSLSFDLSQKNLFAPLVTGGTLCLSSFAHFDPGVVLDRIKDHRVTWINCTPGMLYMLVEHEEAGTRARMSGLRYVFLGGEPIRVSKLIDWLESEGCRAEIVNTYGPTECTDICAFYRIKEPRSYLQKNVPVGNPIHNLRLYVLDQNLQPVPPGVAGELAIGGEGVGPGYLDDALLTAKKFIPPGEAAKAGSVASSPCCPSRIYWSGDRVKRLPDGSIEFLGRMDFQVKIRGYRVELGEIEKVLLSAERVKGAVVTSGEDSSGEGWLCAYVVPAAGMEMMEDELRKHLAAKLPDYMIPAYFIPLERIPLNPNGKINRDRLPRPEVKPGSGYREPGDEVEQKLVEIWAEVLDLDQKVIGINANFFEIGGNSLKINHINSEVKKIFNKDIPLVALFEYPTIKSFSNYLSTLTASDPGEPLAGIEPEGFKTREKNPNRLQDRKKRMRN